MTDGPPLRAASGALAPFRHRAFLVVWLAVLVSNIGTWMRDVASGWLMTDLSPSPLLVSLVQAATTLPVFLLALPAGALADILDRRRLLIAIQVLLLAAAIGLSVATATGTMTPWLLLTLTLLGGTGAALAGPAFQAVVPELVGRAELRPAVALNSLGINVARAIGPALGGAVVAAAGAATAYLLDALSYVAVAAAFLWWRRSTVPSDLPPEALWPAMRTGVRYAAGSADLQRVLLRAAAFFVFGSATWALLPLVVRGRLEGNATLYGMLLGCIGLGAVAGALLLPRLRLPGPALILGGSAATGVATIGLGLSGSAPGTALLLVLAGSAWIAVLTSLNVAAQTALPDWVRARGMALYLAAFYGAMTTGALLWGGVAQAASVEAALVAAGTGALAAAAAAARWVPLPGSEVDHAPSGHWPEPMTAEPVAGDRGPVMVSIAYEVEGADREAFLEALHELGRARQRDGAFGWRVFEDAAEPRRFEEVFFASSWLEHLRQHRHVTGADAALQARIAALHRGAAPPRARHLLAARPADTPVAHPPAPH